MGKYRSRLKFTNERLYNLLNQPRFEIAAMSIGMQYNEEIVNNLRDLCVELDVNPEEWRRVKQIYLDRNIGIRKRAPWTKDIIPRIRKNILDLILNPKSRVNGAARNQSLVEERRLAAEESTQEVESNEEVQESSEDVEEPAREEEQPAREEEQSAREEEQPAREEEQPAKEVEEPAKEVEEPAKKVEQPAKAGEEPDKEVIDLTVADNIVPKVINLSPVRKSKVTITIEQFSNMKLRAKTEEEYDLDTSLDVISKIRPTKDGWLLFVQIKDHKLKPSS